MALSAVGLCMIVVLMDFRRVPRVVFGVVHGGPVQARGRRRVRVLTGRMTRRRVLGRRLGRLRAELLDGRYHGFCVETG